MYNKFDSPKFLLKNNNNGNYVTRNQSMTSFYTLVQCYLIELSCVL